MTPAAIHYHINPSQRAAHLYTVTLHITQPAQDQVVSLPVWIPGSYLVREFARHLQRLSATQAGDTVAVVQRNKHEWQLHCRAGEALQVSYEVFAHDNSVRTAWLDDARGFFNPTSLCLRVVGQEDRPHNLSVSAPDGVQDWRVATGLAPQAVDAQGFGRYRAQDYDELADCPVELGPFWAGEFLAGGVPHQLVVAGAPASFDGAQLLKDTQRICETVVRFWHGDGPPPVSRYVFMLNTVDDGYGGLEHRNSTALICGRRDLPRLGQDEAQRRAQDGYTTLLGLISHEYFHTWNVKRLRPAEFARYDYTQENYTELLWFFEGFTSYYDDLLLRRAGLLDDASYLKLLTKTLQQVMQTPGRHVQSVAQASWDAWVKYYRPDEHTPNGTVSYYTKGALVALCLDLSLRAQGHSLDAVLRGLWTRCQGGPMTEAELLAELQAQTGRSWQTELLTWVHSTEELPLRALLEAQGVAWTVEADAPAQSLGLRVADSGGSIWIKVVLSGGPAHAAGLSAGDEWLGVDGWRLSRLDDLALYTRPGQTVSALVARDKRLLNLPLTLPAQASTGATPRLSVKDSAQVSAWLAA